MLNLDQVRMDTMMLSSAPERKVSALIKTLKVLDNVSKKLQRPDSSVYSAGVYLNIILEDYPGFSD